MRCNSGLKSQKSESHLGPDRGTCFSASGGQLDGQNLTPIEESFGTHVACLKTFGCKPQLAGSGPVLVLIMAEL